MLNRSEVRHSRLIIIMGLLMVQIIAFAQKPIPHPNATQIALSHIIEKSAQLNLTKEDVSNVYVQDSYTTDHNGLTHVFIIQQHNGIDVYNGIINVNVMPSGEVLSTGNRFISDLARAVAGITSSKSIGAGSQLSAAEAVDVALQALKIPTPRATISVKESQSHHQYIFDKMDIALRDISAKLCYFPSAEGKLHLVWDVNIDLPNGHENWLVKLDARTGQVIDKKNHVIKCTFNHDAYRHIEDCYEETPLSKIAERAAESPAVPPANGGTYRVFALPVESPVHGNRTVVTNPADPVASPFGWHDTNGVEGADFTITRGNNVHAYLDWNDRGFSQLDEPNGGNELVFDFPFLPQSEPDTSRQAAVTNLFYMNNMMHDISFRYGFNEAAGNFQARNYTGAPGANDYVFAEAQDGAKLAAGDLTRNNATFTPTPDGSSGRMEMYVWTRTGEKLIHVTAPQNLRQDLVTGTGNFGAQITTTPITAEAVFADDGTSLASQGCNTFINNVTGKIVLIDRGSCEFGRKALNAQQKGALAVIICNFEDKTILMGAGAVGSQVTIPVLNIKKSDATRIRSAAGNGLTISLYRDAVAVGPELIDGDFDNGIIAHEYTHGISSRLTGGRLNSSCLSQGEQSDGEGWSDFLALALTARPTDKGNSKRGIGNFVLRQTTNDIGIRRNFYTTDMTESPWTYDDIIRSPRVHDVGEVWVAPLWDLYWQFVDLYGFDANLRNTNSGNGRMLKLVIDGMKIQPCNPGFLDARDAIIAADKANFNGQHECMIWSAFARRGFGFNAKQGLALRYDDNTEGFETRPQCVQKLKITKTANVESIRPGEPITYTITVTNHKAEALTGVIVTDELPAGLTLIAGSANRAVSVAAGVLTWTIGNMARDTTLTLTYRVNTATDKMSILQFLDSFEKGDNNWDLEDPKMAGNIWEVLDAPAKSGKKVARVTYTGLTVSSEQLFSLNKNIKVTGAKPVLRFYHKYNTQPAFDGGMVQISTNNGSTWENVETKFFKNPYRGRLTYDAFATLNLFAFWGKVDTFIASCVDLSSYIGKDIRVRFRFGSDDSANNFEGWTVDDVAVFDMFNYNGRARVISNQRDTAFADVPERGTIVDPSVMTPVSDLSDGLSVQIFPNPTFDVLNLHIKGAASNQGSITIHTADGRVMQQQSVALSQGNDTILPIDVSALATGFYFIKIQTDNKIVVKKMVKH